MPDRVQHDKARARRTSLSPGAFDVNEWVQGTLSSISVSFRQNFGDTIYGTNGSRSLASDDERTLTGIGNGPLHLLCDCRRKNTC